MMDKMDKLKKKKSKEMSSVEKDAKMSVVESLRDMAAKAMGDKLHGLKKVTVASDSKQGLEKGLEKAQDLLSNSPEAAAMKEKGQKDPMSDVEESSDPFSEMEESPEHEASESSEEESEEHEELSEDELDEKIKKLLAQKEAMKKSKF